MEITLKRNFGFELIFEADNIRVVEDIESRQYPQDENGKTIVNMSPKRDIKTDIIEQFVSLLDDMVYYRVEAYDSSGLIKRLFDRLPGDMAASLIKELSVEYGCEL